MISSAPTEERSSGGLEGLLLLCRSLARGARAATLPQALELLLPAAACSKGAAFRAVGGGLELVADQGMPEALRRPLASLALDEVPWFVAQRAARFRAPVVDDDLSVLSGGRLDRAVLASSGWWSATAAPLFAGASLLGVVLLVGPAAADREATASLEVACHLLGSQVARASELRATDPSLGASDAPRVERGSPGEAGAESGARAIGTSLGLLAAELLDGLRPLSERFCVQRQELDRLRDRLGPKAHALRAMYGLNGALIAEVSTLSTKAARLRTAAEPLVGPRSLDGLPPCVEVDWPADSIGPSPTVGPLLLPRRPGVPFPDLVAAFREGPSPSRSPSPARAPHRAIPPGLPPRPELDSTPPTRRTGAVDPAPVVVARPPLRRPRVEVAPPPPRVRLEADARAAAQLLRTGGPRRGLALLSALKERGLSAQEGFAVITYGLAHGILVRSQGTPSLLVAGVA